MTNPSSSTRTRAPFTSRPTTREIAQVDGSLAYRIRAWHQTPWTAWLGDQLGTLSALTLAAGTSYWALQAYPDDATLLIFTLGGAFVVHRPLQWLWRQVLRVRTSVEITRNTLRLRRLLRWRTYDRTKPHRFALLEHDRARRERDEHEIEARKAQMDGRVAEPPKYYQESWHVVFELVGQRVDVATVYRQKPARALQARLAGCALVIDGEAGTGEGVARSARQEWRRQPGDIPA